MNLNIQTSKVFKELQRRKERCVVLEGSARSTKTYSIIQHLITIALENEEKGKKDLRMICLRSRLTWAKHSLISDFQKILKGQFKMWKEKDMNKNASTYQLGRTEFIFGGLDHEHGQKFHGMPSDYAWFNEANEIDFPSVNQIMTRMTGQAFFDYNPNMSKNHWLILKIQNRLDCAILHSTYKDNPFLAQSIIDELEIKEPTEENIKNGTADETHWKIYGLGIRAEIKGLIFNIKIVPAFPTVNDYCYGMDFGFTNDPSTLIKTALKDGELYFNEELYERGLTNIINPQNPDQPSIQERFIDMGIPTDKTIWADCAEPKSIVDLQNCDYDVQPVKKGAGSIMDGIMTMKRYPINVTETSYNMIDEGYKYKWGEDKNGDSTNEPVKSFDHTWDAARYATYMGLDISPHSNAKPVVLSLRMNTGANKYAH